MKPDCRRLDVKSKQLKTNWIIHELWKEVIISALYIAIFYNKHD